MSVKAFFVATGLILSTPFVTFQAEAQDVGLEALLACQAITDNAERLKCLDNATRRLAGEEPVEETTTPSPAAPAQQNPADDVIRLNRPDDDIIRLERSAIAAERAALAAEREALAAERAELAEAQEAEEAESRLPIWARVRRESVNGEEVPDEFEVSVVKITRNNIGRHFFYTDDGHVWEQVELADFRPPSGLPSSARVRRGAFGSQRLIFDDGRASAPRVRPQS